MKKVRVIYYLNEKGRKKSLLAGGNGNSMQEIEADITEELLEFAEVDSKGNAELRIGSYRRLGEPKIVGTYNFRNYMWNVDEFYNEHKPKVTLEAEIQRFEFDKPQTVESLLKFHKEKLAEIARHDEEIRQKAQQLEKEILPEKIKLWEKAVADKKKEIAKIDAISAAHEAEKKRREQEKAEWIRKYGSDYLKDCLELGVKANLEYVVERAAMEFPDYIVDYAECADWEEKFSPSREALSELKKLRANGVDAEIVWLTKEPKVRKDDDDNYYYDDEFEPCEAILIRNYLGYYNLFKIIG